jgi:hypothetical protein
MSTQTIFVGLGLLITLLMGLLCEYFLTKSVTAKPKAEFARHEVGGGAYQLGVLERILFFVSFLLGENTLAAGWLGFKVAAKWASWQHVVKISEKNTTPRERIIISSRLLGRFLNGTLFNGLCAAVGVMVAKVIAPDTFGPMLNHTSNERWRSYLAIGFPVGLTLWIVWLLFRSKKTATRTDRLAEYLMPTQD